MAHRGRKKGGRRARSVPRATTININERSTPKRRSGHRRRASYGRRTRRFGRSVGNAAGTLSKERGPLMLISFGAGLLDAKYQLAKSGQADQIGALIAKIPTVGPIGWKGLVGAAAHFYHSKNRRNRLSDRLATTFLNLELYGKGVAYGGVKSLSVAGNAPNGGGFIPAG